MRMTLLLLFSDYGRWRPWCMDEFSFMTIHNNDNNAISCKLFCIHIFYRSDPLKINWTIGNAVCAWAGYIYRIIYLFLFVGWVYLIFSHSATVEEMRSVLFMFIVRFIFSFQRFFFSVLSEMKFHLSIFFSLRTLFILRCALRQFSNKLQWCTTTHRTQVENWWK